MSDIPRKQPPLAFRLTPRQEAQRVEEQAEILEIEREGECSRQLALWTAKWQRLAEVPEGRLSATVFWAVRLASLEGSALDAYERAHGRPFAPTWREVGRATEPHEPVMAELLASMELNRAKIKSLLPPVQKGTPEQEVALSWWRSHKLQTPAFTLKLLEYERLCSQLQTGQLTEAERLHMDQLGALLLKTSAKQFEDD